MRNLIAAAAVTAAFLGGTLAGAHHATPTQADLDESAASLCAELGGTWRLDAGAGWCDIDV